MRRFDGLTFIAIGLIIFMGGMILRDLGVSGAFTGALSVDSVSASAPEQLADSASNGKAGLLAILPEFGQGGAGDPNAIAAPYPHFFVTQGPHGFDYGHMAIDISAGKGAPILSPINGVVAKLFIDEWGNPSLVLENERYLVEILHGLYSVHPGDQVTLGQPIGEESNQGNTVDELGRSCRGRDCGYHTHINVYDKQLGANVNPLLLFGQ
jgi:murein DD-endopeptidase MepM/ murein hydrolase activator NlpD